MASGKKWNHAEVRFLKQIIAEIKTLNLLLLLSRGRFLKSCLQALPTMRPFTQVLFTMGTATRHRRKHSTHMPRQWGWAAWLFPSLCSTEEAVRESLWDPRCMRQFSFTIITVYFYNTHPAQHKEKSNNNCADTYRLLLGRWTLLKKPPQPKREQSLTILNGLWLLSEPRWAAFIFSFQNYNSTCSQLFFQSSCPHLSGPSFHLSYTIYAHTYGY